MTFSLMIFNWKSACLHLAVGAQTAHLPVIQLSEPVVWLSVSRLTGVQPSALQQESLLDALTAPLFGSADAASWGDRINLSEHT